MVIPLISGYGSSYGKYGGSRATDYTQPGDIDVSKLNTNLEVDGVQFNLFEQSKLYYHAPQWANQFAVFDATAGINVYELPQFMMNNLSYVGYKKDILGLNYTPGSLAFDMTLAFFNTNSR